MNDLLRMSEFWAALLGAAVGGISSVIGGFVLHRWIDNLRNLDQIRILRLKSVIAQLGIASGPSQGIEAYHQYMRYLRQMNRDWEPRFEDLAIALHRTEMMLEAMGRLVEVKEKLAGVSSVSDAWPRWNHQWEHPLNEIEKLAQAAHDEVEAFEWWRMLPEGRLSS